MIKYWNQWSARLFCLTYATSFIPSFGLHVSGSVLPLSHLYCVHLCYRNKLILCFALFFLHVSIFFFMDNCSLHSLIFSLPFLLITLKKERKKESLLWYCFKGSQLLYVREEKDKKKGWRRGGVGLVGWLGEEKRKEQQNWALFLDTDESWTFVKTWIEVLSLSCN